MEKIVRKALILDFDGTVRTSKSGNIFSNNLEDFVLVEGIAEKIGQYKKDEHLICICSNQGGIAHGYKTEQELFSQFDYIEDLLKISLNLDYVFDSIIYCPYMEDGKIEQFSFKSLLRKPQIGMLVELENEFYDYGIIIDWDNSLFVGDQDSDKQCAERAGIKYLDIVDFLLK